MAAEKAAELAAEKAVQKVLGQVCDRAVAAAIVKVDEKLDPALKSFETKLADFENRLLSIRGAKVSNGARPTSTPPSRTINDKCNEEFKARMVI